MITQDYISMAAASFLTQFKTANIAIKLIVINVIAFLFFGLLSFVLGNQGQSGIDFWFVLPSDLDQLLFQPWGVFTYAFLHGSVMHILFNMLLLYWFSTFILNLFTQKRLLTIYLLGAFAGGLFFLVSYNIFPVFSGSKGYLVGASAAVNALIVFIATYTPNTPIRVFTFKFRLWHFAAFVVLRDLFSLAAVSENSGGMIAHLGGALFGYVYAQQLAKGNDIGLWFETIIDRLVNSFKKNNKKRTSSLSRKQKQKKSPLRTVYKKKNATKNNTKSPKQQEIDAILDKISKSGYDSLSKAEKDFLFNAGKDS